MSLTQGRRKVINYWPWAAAALATLLTTLAYGPGLHGPFLLDDQGNLEPLQRWMSGNLSLKSVLLDNRSGPGGRPLSMLTFLFDTWRSGSLNSATFKATNLAVHLITGALSFELARQIFLTRPTTAKRATGLAAFVALTWLWMPIQVSTVLYVVQRMAQLSALFTFATLIVYLYARSRILNRRPSGHYLLWAGVPALTLLAAMAKENGALALPLAAVIEIAIFTNSERPKSVKCFLLVAVALPISCAAIFVAARPDWITRGYEIRDFTIGQRLLTEPRILWDYLLTSFFPMGPKMGIFHDNYVVSKNLMSPPTAAISIACWLATLFLAIALRTKAPIFFLGTFGYVVALSLESGPIALELYFEHRNYGPVFFAIIALVGLWAAAAQAITKRNQKLPRLTAACACALLVLYFFGTWNQAQAWGVSSTFYAIQYDYNPGSPRLISSLTAQAMTNHDTDKALYLISQSEIYSPPSELPASTLWRFLAYCEAEPYRQIPDGLYRELESRAHGRITTYSMVAWELLAARLSNGCSDVNRKRITNAGLAWLKEAPQKESAQAMWRTRYNIARIIADNNQLADARTQVAEAWEDSDHNNGIGVLLFQLNASLGDTEGCKRVLAALEKSSTGDDALLDRAVQTFRKAVNNGEIRSGAP